MEKLILILTGLTVVTGLIKILWNYLYLKLMNTIKKAGRPYKERNADEIIKNTYRTLMTRGQKGCYIYCTDKKLSDYLKKRLNQNNGITYPIDEEENNYNMRVAEDDEEYKFE